MVASGACRATYRADRGRRKPPLIRVIVKLPTRDATGRESGVTQALYAREFRFYTELAGVVGITTPAACTPGSTQTRARSRSCSMTSPRRAT